MRASSPTCRIVGERHVAAGRQPPEHHPEEHDQHQAQPEVGHRHADQREGEHRLVDPGVRIHRGDHPARQADGHGEEQREARQRQRHRNPLGDRLGDRAVEQDRIAEVATGECDVPVGEPGDEGPVQSQLLANLRDLRVGGALPGDQRRRVAGDELHDRRGDQADQQ